MRKSLLKRACWYVHFASCFYIDIYCIMGCYYTLCHNTYAYSLLSYKVYTKRENVGCWNSGLEKEQILKTYSAQLQKSWNFMEVSFRIYKKIGWTKHQRGPPTVHEGGGRLLPPWERPRSREPPWSPSMPIFWYKVSFAREKNQKEAFETKHHRL